MAYKGMMLSDVPNLRLHDRLHQRLLDAEGRPHLRIRLPAAQPHGRARLPQSACPQLDRPDRRRPSRCSTSTPATSCASLDQFPKQGSQAAVAAAPELRCSTCGSLHYGEIDDGTMQFSRSPARAPSSPNRPEVAAVP